MADSFDIRKMSVAEIIYVLGLCDQARPYVKYGRDLRAAWENMEEAHATAIGERINFHQTEPDFPEEMYERILPMVDFAVMKKKEAVEAIRRMQIPYSSLKPKYRRKSDWDDVFNKFLNALEKYVNKWAKDHGIVPW